MMKSKWPRRLRRTAWVLGGGGVVIFVALRLTPLPPALESALPESAEFVDRNGQPLRLLLVDERRYSERCTLAEMSPTIIAATLSAEDKRFRQHRGVDLLATGRALRHAVLWRKGCFGRVIASKSASQCRIRRVAGSD